MTWPPEIGKPLPRAVDAHGVRGKLAGYSLDLEHTDGGDKASAFDRILGITAGDVEYLANALITGLASTPTRAVRQNPPHGLLCEVRISVRGLGAKADRIATVLTAWEIRYDGDAPRLVTAYITS